MEHGDCPRAGVLEMSQPTATRTVVVANQAGLHARAALLIAKLVRRLQEQGPLRVELVDAAQRVDAADMLQLLTMGAKQGQQLTVEAEGAAAEEAVEALAELFAARFHEEEPQED
jgi:phosphocarrier protein HPr